MDFALYDNAMQVVPLFMIALFLDNRKGEDMQASARSRQWERVQDRIFVLLGVLGFVTSMLVVAGSIEPSRVTDGIVIAALSGSMGLLFAQIWRRFSPVRKAPSTEVEDASS